MTRLLVCSALLLLCSVKPGIAQNLDFTWLNPNGGDFNNPGLWTPFDPSPPVPMIGPGGSTDRVHFGQGVTPGNRYTVTNVDGTNDQLLIHNDSLKLDIVGRSDAANLLHVLRLSRL